jgi:hypothetical protein
MLMRPWNGQEVFMSRAALSLLLVAVVTGPLRADDRPQESGRMTDARVQLDVAFSWGRIVVKQGRTVVYEPAAEPPRRQQRSDREGGTTGTPRGTLAPTPLKPEPVGDRRFPPPYFATRTGEAALKIEAGLGNYEVSIELGMP